MLFGKTALKAQNDYIF